MIEPTLRKLLVGAALIGESVMPSTEIGIVAQGLPKVGYTRVSAPRGLNDSGPDGIVTARYQLDVFAATLAAAGAITDRLRVALNGCRGTGEDAAIVLIRFDDDSFESTVPAAGANAAAARIHQDVFVTYRE